MKYNEKSLFPFLLVKSHSQRYLAPELNFLLRIHTSAKAYAQPGSDFWCIFLQLIYVPIHSKCVSLWTRLSFLMPAQGFAS